MITQIEKLKNKLQSAGFSTNLDEDGDLLIEYKEKKIYFIVDEEMDYLVLVMPNIYAYEQSKEDKVLEACNYATRNTKAAKVTCENGSVLVSVELFLQDITTISVNTINKYLSAMLFSVVTFYKNIKLISE